MTSEWFDENMFLPVKTDFEETGPEFLLEKAPRADSHQSQ
jgi:hypothetical protein